MTASCQTLTSPVLHTDRQILLNSEGLTLVLHANTGVSLNVILPNRPEINKIRDPRRLFSPSALSN